MRQTDAKIKFISITDEKKNSDVIVGLKYPIVAEVDLGELTPDDVDLQIYYGKFDENLDSVKSWVPMTNQAKKPKTNPFVYRGDIECRETGQYGYTLRILPKHKLLINQFELGLIRWA